MGLPDKPEPKSEHIEKPFKEIEKQFKEEKESIKTEHKEIKEKENIKAEHKDFKEIKENIKEIKVEVKEHPEKPLKEKDKDKEVIEGGGIEQLGDPMALLHSLHARVSSIEEHLGIGAEAFVQPEERPPVGGSVAKEAKERPSKASQASKEE
jgi:hypothetical protein